MPYPTGTPRPYIFTSKNTTLKQSTNSENVLEFIPLPSLAVQFFALTPNASLFTAVRFHITCSPAVHSFYSFAVQAFPAVGLLAFASPSHASLLTGCAQHSLPTNHPNSPFRTTIPTQTTAKTLYLLNKGFKIT